MAAGRRVKEEGAQNDLLERIAKDDNFSAVHATLHQLLDPAVRGLCFIPTTTANATNTITATTTTATTTILHY